MACDFFTLTPRDPPGLTEGFPSTHMKKISLLTPLVLATLRWNALGAELDFNRDIRPILSEHCFIPRPCRNG